MRAERSGDDDDELNQVVEVIGYRRAKRLTLLIPACLALLLPQPTQAQDAVLEALYQHRQLVRMAEVIGEIGPRAEPYGPAEIPAERPLRARLRPQMPTLLLPPAPRPPLVTRARPEPTEQVHEPPELTELRWERVPPGQEERFMLRFVESLWANIGGRSVPIDTMATPEIRARLNATFGPPTRSPVARSRPQMQAGSEFVQFEYWFVVNDSIPVVVMDRRGPFGRGVVLIADEDHRAVFDTIKQDLADRLVTQTRLMPYVDYYQDRESGQWYRTGFDGERFYATETDRPRWARRGHSAGRWYDFR